MSSAPQLLLRIEPPRAEVTHNGPRPADTTTYFPAGPSPLLDLVAVVRNTSPYPVQTWGRAEEMPALRDADGRAVQLADVRLVARPMPKPPPSPAPLVQPGQEQEVARFPIGRKPEGLELHTPFGTTLLAPGRYRAAFAVELRRIPRSDWLRRYAFSLGSFGVMGGPDGLPLSPEQAAEQAAAGDEDFWQVESSVWWGRLESPELELVLEP